MNAVNRTVVLLIVATLSLIASSALAADQLVFGKKLLIMNPPSGAAANKVVHLAKDATISVGAVGGAGDPQCTGAGGGGMSSLRIVASGGAGDITIPLPCAGWTTNAHNTLYKYIDRTGSSCRAVLVKDGVLVKAACKGTQVAIDLSGTMSPVQVVTTLNTQQYCTEFGGTAVKDGSDDKKFLRKDASAPGSCPPPTLACGFVTKWGMFGSADGQFISPTGIAVDGSGNVYVADYGNNRIQKFTSGGTFLTKWGSFGSADGQFDTPVVLGVDGTANVYVVDANNSRIQKFTSGGTFVTKWGSSGSGNGQFDFFFGGVAGGGIAVDGSGNVYVADYGNDRIQKFTSGGTFLAQWGSIGTADGQFARPSGVALDASSNVYVADRANNRIQKFTSGGTFLAKWGSTGSGDGQFDAPTDIAVDGSGNVYVTDALNNRVQQFTSGGIFVTKWGSVGSGDGQFGFPEGGDVDGAGNVYVADTANDRIQKFHCP